MPCQNASTTAIITIKPEYLTHFCVEHVFLYAWMCYTSWFELQVSILILTTQPPFCCVSQLGWRVWVEFVSHMPYSCFGWRRDYVCFGFDLKVKCLRNKKNLAGYSAVRSTDEWISFLDVTTSTLHSSDRTP